MATRKTPTVKTKEHLKEKTETTNPSKKSQLFVMLTNSTSGNNIDQPSRSREATVARSASVSNKQPIPLRHAENKKSLARPTSVPAHTDSLPSPAAGKPSARLIMTSSELRRRNSCKPDVMRNYNPPTSSQSRNVEGSRSVPPTVAARERTAAGSSQRVSFLRSRRTHSCSPDVLAGQGHLGRATLISQSVPRDSPPNARVSVPAKPEDIGSDTTSQQFSRFNNPLRRTLPNMGRPRIRDYTRSSLVSAGPDLPKTTETQASSPATFGSGDTKDSGEEEGEEGADCAPQQFDRSRSLRVSDLIQRFDRGQHHLQHGGMNENTAAKKDGMGKSNRKSTDMTNSPTKTNSSSNSSSIINNNNNNNNNNSKNGKTYNSSSNDSKYNNDDNNNNRVKDMISKNRSGVSNKNNINQNRSEIQGDNEKSNKDAGESSYPPDLGDDKIDSASSFESKDGSGSGHKEDNNDGNDANDKDNSGSKVKEITPQKSQLTMHDTEVKRADQCGDKFRGNLNNASNSAGARNTASLPQQTKDREGEFTTRNVDSKRQIFQSAIQKHVHSVPNSSLMITSQKPERNSVKHTPSSGFQIAYDAGGTRRASLGNPSVCSDSPQPKDAPGSQNVAPSAPSNRGNHLMTVDKGNNSYGERAAVSTEPSPDPSSLCGTRSNEAYRNSQNRVMSTDTDSVPTDCSETEDPCIRASENRKDDPTSRPVDSSAVSALSKDIAAELKHKVEHQSCQRNKNFMVRNCSKDTVAAESLVDRRHSCVEYNNVKEHKSPSLKDLKTSNTMPIKAHSIEVLTAEETGGEKTKYTKSSELSDQSLHPDYISAVKKTHMSSQQVSSGKTSKPTHKVKETKKRLLFRSRTFSDNTSDKDIAIVSFANSKINQGASLSPYQRITNDKINTTPSENDSVSLTTEMVRSSDTSSVGHADDTRQGKASDRINSALATLRLELQALRNQDVALLKQLITISAVIQRLQRSRALRVSKSLSFSSSGLHPLAAPGNLLRQQFYSHDHGNGYCYDQQQQLSIHHLTSISSRHHDLISGWGRLPEPISPDEHFRPRPGQEDSNCAGHAASLGSLTPGLTRQMSTPTSAESRRLNWLAGGSFRSSTDSYSSASSFDYPSGLSSPSELEESYSSLHSLLASAPAICQSPPRWRIQAAMNTPLHISELKLDRDVTENDRQSYEEILWRNVKLWKVNKQQSSLLVEEVACLH